jgi:hypothetical protein
MRKGTCHHLHRTLRCVSNLALPRSSSVQSMSFGSRKLVKAAGRVQSTKSTFLCAIATRRSHIVPRTRSPVCGKHTKYDRNNTVRTTGVRAIGCMAVHARYANETMPNVAPLRLLEPSKICAPVPWQSSDQHVCTRYCAPGFRLFALWKALYSVSNCLCGSRQSGGWAKTIERRIKFIKTRTTAHGISVMHLIMVGQEEAIWSASAGIR